MTSQWLCVIATHDFFFPSESTTNIEIYLTSKELVEPRNHSTLLPSEPASFFLRLRSFPAIQLFEVFLQFLGLLQLQQDTASQLALPKDLPFVSPSPWSFVAPPWQLHLESNALDWSSLQNWGIGLRIIKSGFMMWWSYICWFQHQTNKWKLAIHTLIFYCNLWLPETVYFFCNPSIPSNLRMFALPSFSRFDDSEIPDSHGRTDIIVW